MSRYETAATLDSSIDDVGLLRICEQRIMGGFSRWVHNVSFRSVDSTSSVDASRFSASASDETIESRPKESDTSPTPLLENICRCKCNSASVFRNVSLNQNSYHDGRRWAGEDDCCCFNQRRKQVLCHRNIGSNKQVNGCMRESPSCSRNSTDGLNCRRRCMKQNSSTETSDSTPVIDNLILEPRNGVRCVANENALLGRIFNKDKTLSNESGPNFSGEKGVRADHQNAAGNEHNSSSKSPDESKPTLDPSSELYLKRLDFVLETKNVRNNKPIMQSAETSSACANKKGTNFSSVNRCRKVSLNKKPCDWPNKLVANKPSENDSAKRLERSRNRIGLRPSVNDNIRNVSKHAPKLARVPQIEKKKQLDSSGHLPQEPAKDHNLALSAQRIPSAGNKKRSKSLSSLTQFRPHSLQSFSLLDRHETETSAPVNKFTKQQLEILKHVPGDITNKELSVLIKTVLSVVQRKPARERTPARRCAGQNKQDSHGRDVKSLKSKGKKGLKSEAVDTTKSASVKHKIYCSNQTSDVLDRITSLKPNTEPETVESKNESNLSSLTTQDSLQHVTNNKSTNHGNKITFCDTLSKPSTSAHSEDTVGESQLRFAFVSTPKVDIDSSSEVSGSSSLTYTLGNDNYNSPDSCNKVNKCAWSSQKDTTTLPSGNRTDETVSVASGSSGSWRHSGSRLTISALRNMDLQGSTSPESPEKLHSKYSCGTSSNQTSRKVEYVFPMNTYREQLSTNESCQKYDCSLPIRSGCLSVDEHDSALSDSLLYSKHSRIAKSILLHDTSYSHRGLRNSGRSQERSVNFRRVYRRSSSTSLINDQRLSDSRHHSSLLPCPHERIQRPSFTCHRRPNTYWTNPEFSDTLHNRIDTVSRPLLQNNHRSPLGLMYAEVNGTSLEYDGKIRQAHVVLPEVRKHLRQDTFIKKKAYFDWHSPTEATDLDALSCSADTVLTNTSLSNRLMEIEEETSYNPRRQRKPRELFFSSTNVQQFTPFCSENKFKDQAILDNTKFHNCDDMLCTRNAITGVMNARVSSAAHEERFSAYTSNNMHPGLNLNREICNGVSICLQQSPLVTSVSDALNSSCGPITTANEATTRLLPSVLSHELGRVFEMRQEQSHTATINWKAESSQPMTSDSDNEYCDKESSHDSETQPNQETFSQLPSFPNSEPVSSLESIHQYLQSSRELAAPTCILKPQNQSQSVCYFQTLSNVDKNEPHRNVGQSEDANLDCDLEKSNSLETSAKLDPQPPHQTSAQNLPFQTVPSKVADLSALKKSAESLLAEVYRKYYVDLLAPNMVTYDTTDLGKALEILQNFSPIRQVDVNTSYLLPTNLYKPRTSASNNLKKDEVNPATAISNKDSQNSMKDESICATECNTKTSLTSADEHPNNKSHKRKEKNVSKTKLAASNSGRCETCKTLNKKPQPGNVNQRQTTVPTKSDCQRLDKTEPQREGTNGIVIDVTSVDTDSSCSHSHSGDFGQVETNDKNGMIMRTYNPTSALPVEVKVLTSRTLANEVLNSNNFTESTSAKPNTSSDFRKRPFTTVVHCGLKKCASDKRALLGACIPERSQLCTVILHGKSDGAAARLKLASTIKNVSTNAANDISPISSSISDDMTNSYPQ